MIKALRKLGTERKYLNIYIYDKPTANVILDGEKLKPFPLKSRMIQGCPLSTFLARAIRKEEEIVWPCEKAPETFARCQITQAWSHCWLRQK
jgi:hypothetical protein